jgi:hypothetical protein
LLSKVLRNLVQPKNSATYFLFELFFFHNNLDTLVDAIFVTNKLIQMTKMSCVCVCVCVSLLCSVPSRLEMPCVCVTQPGKPFFVEIRTFWHLFQSFDRMWAFYILGLQVSCSSVEYRERDCQGFNTLGF